MRTGDSFEDALYERDYNPWVVNQAFSFHLDTILYANQMNMYPELNKRAQYEFLLNGIRKGKRWSKWHKFADSKEISNVCEYYSCNRNVAKEYLNILTKEQLNVIESRLKKGGDNKK